MLVLSVMQIYMQMCRDSLHIFVKFKRISCKFCYKNQAGFLLKKEKSVYYIFLYILYTIKVYRKFLKTSYFYKNNSII